MITIENVETYGWQATVRGMRNPMNSWDKSDSRFCMDCDGCPYKDQPNCDSLPMENGKCFFLGENDLSLMKRLSTAGDDHGKFLRMIGVSMDITAPLYFWKEFDTYKVGTVANSCSTMHKIQAKEFTIDDFSHDHLLANAEEVLRHTIDALNEYRNMYNETKDKDYWWQMIQLLPSSYNQKRTVTLNYAVLRHMYAARKSHKLDEWRTFCNLVSWLPYATDLICN